MQDRLSDRFEEMQSGCPPPVPSEKVDFLWADWLKITPRPLELLVVTSESQKEA